MYTMVLMMAVGGSADATAFGGRRNKGCDGGAAVAYAGCTGSFAGAGYAGCTGSGYMPAYAGCSGVSYAAPVSNGCDGGRKRGGFLGGLFGHHKNKGGCTGGVSAGCTGYVPAPACCPTPAPVCCPAPVASGCYGSMVSSPVVMGGPVMAAPCMTPGMAPLTVTPATPTTTPDKMPAPESKPATPSTTPPAAGTKI